MCCKCREPAPSGRRAWPLTQIDPAIDSKVGTKMNNALVVGRRARSFLLWKSRAVVLPEEGRGRRGGGSGGVIHAAAFRKRQRARAAALRRQNAEQKNKRRREKSGRAFVGCVGLFAARR